MHSSEVLKIGKPRYLHVLILSSFRPCAYIFGTLTMSISSYVADCTSNC